MSTTRELPSSLRLGPHIPINADWIDVQYVLQEVEAELRNEVLAVGFETMANAHQAMAEGARKVANILRGGKQQQRG